MDAPPTKISVEIMPKEEIIYYDWHEIMAFEHGEEGIALSTRGWEASRTPHLNVAPFRFMVDENLRRLDNKISRVHMLNALPSCSGHFIEIKTFWDGYCKDLETIAGSTAYAFGGNYEALIMTGNNSSYKSPPSRRFEIVGSTISRHTTLNIKAEVEKGIYGWAFNANEATDWFKVSDFERAIVRYGISNFAKIKRITEGRYGACIIIVEAPNRRINKNTWETIAEIAEEIY